MVAGINNVEPTIEVAAPCFLEAVISRKRSDRIRSGIRFPRSYCTYGFVTCAAEENVANGKGCIFSLDREFARLLCFRLPFRWHLTVYVHPSARGQLADALLCDYTVTLQEPADLAASRISEKEPTGLSSPQGLHRAVLICTIQKQEQVQQPPALQLRLVFQDLPLWHETEKQDHPKPEFLACRSSPCPICANLPVLKFCLTHHCVLFLVQRFPEL
jgi:hypothetical protein